MMPSVAMNQLEKKSQLDLSPAYPLSLQCARNVPVLFIRNAAGRQLSDVRSMLSAHSRIFGHILLLFAANGLLSPVRYGFIDCGASLRRPTPQTILFIARICVFVAVLMVIHCPTYLIHFILAIKIDSGFSVFFRISCRSNEKFKVNAETVLTTVRHNQ